MLDLISLPLRLTTLPSKHPFSANNIISGLVILWILWLLPFLHSTMNYTICLGARPADLGQGPLPAGETHWEGLNRSHRNEGLQGGKIQIWRAFLPQPQGKWRSTVSMAAHEIPKMWVTPVSLTNQVDSPGFPFPSAVLCVSAKAAQEGSLPNLEVSPTFLQLPRVLC